MTALCHLFGHEGTQFFGRFAFEQRALAAAHGQVGTERVGRGFEVERAAHLVHVLHIVEEAGRTSAARHDDALKLGHLVEHPPFEVAKPLFAFLGKDLGHALVETLFDVPIKVVEDAA